MDSSLDLICFNLVCSALISILFIVVNVGPTLLFMAMYSSYTTRREGMSLYRAIACDL